VGIEVYARRFTPTARRCLIKNMKTFTSCNRPQLTNFMKQKLYWEAHSRSAVQEISCLLWKPKVLYHIHNSPPLSHVNPVHTLTIYSFKGHFNTVLSSHLQVYATYPARVILHSINLIIVGEEYNLWSSSLFNFVHLPVSCSVLGPNILQHYSRSFLISLLPSHGNNINKCNKSTGESPSWKINWSSTNQEFPRLLWNSNVHCRFRKSSPLDSSLTIQDTFLYPIFLIYFNIILPSIPMFRKRLFS